MLLLQRCFWVGTTDHPAPTIATNMPGQLFAIGRRSHLAAGPVLLVIAQLVFARLENKIPERL